LNRDAAAACFFNLDLLGVFLYSKLMKLLHDCEGRAVRLTDERSKHILEHPEMRRMVSAIEETLTRPERVIQSISDPGAHLYYRFYFGTRVGDKYLCVVVKIKQQDAFVLTAYLTDTIKKGDVVWPKRS
jgi:hypothetical protein